MSAFYPDAASGLRYHDRFAYVVPRKVGAAPVFDYDHRHAYALLHVSATAQGSTSWPGAVLIAPSQTVFDLPVSTDCFGRLPYRNAALAGLRAIPPAMSAAPFCRPPGTDTGSAS